MNCYRLRIWWDVFLKLIEEHTTDWAIHETYGFSEKIAIAKQEISRITAGGIKRRIKNKTLNL